MNGEDEAAAGDDEHRPARQLLDLAGICSKVINIYVVEENFEFSEPCLIILRRQEFVDENKW